jgi:hypothetical protein
MKEGQHKPSTCQSVKAHAVLQSFNGHPVAIEPAAVCAEIQGCSCAGLIVA